MKTTRLNQLDSRGAIKRSILVVLLVATASAAHAASYVVNASTDAGGAGGAGTGTTGDLRYCVNMANMAGGTSTITFDPTVFAAATTITLASGQLELNADITITGRGASILTVSGNNASRVFQIDSNRTCTISNLTVTGGNGVGALSSGKGGGILNAGTLTLTNCVVTSNATPTSEGGGIDNTGTVLNVTNSTISNNTASFSGGGLISRTGTVTITGSTVSNNSVTGATGGAGGGMEADCALTVTNSTFSGNHADNSGTNSGGGLYCGSNVVVITATTITGNSAKSSGSAGGLRNDGATSITVKNTIVAGNTGSSSANADVSGAFISSGYNLIGNGTGGTGFTGTADQVGTTATPINALLDTLKDNGGSTFTHALLTGSPAIDAGKAFGLNSDQRGFARTQDFTTVTNATGGDGSDIGAFEVVVPTATTTTAVNASTTFNSSAQNITLSATVTATITSPAVSPKLSSILNQGTVTFQVMKGATLVGSAVTSGTLSSGAASVSYSLPAGTAVGVYTISATYNGTTSFGTSSDTTKTLTVTTGPLAKFSVSAPSTATAGSAISVTVTAQDAFGNTITSYVGTVHFTSSDSKAVLPVDSKLTSGVGTFSVTLATAGNQTITATDTESVNITGVSGNVLVAAVATKFAITVPTTATSGVSFSATVTATDATGNTVPGYNGTVHFTSSDAGATLPADATLTSGVGTFTVTLKTVGNQTLTATDTVNSALTQTTGSILVSARITIISGPNITIMIQNVNGVFTVVTDPANAVITWNFGDGTPAVNGSSVTHIFTTPGTYTITVTATDPVSGASVSQTYSVVVTSLANPVALAGTNEFRVRHCTIKLGANKNTIAINALLHLIAGEKISGTTLKIDVNGVTHSFVLGANGSARDATGSIGLSFRSNASGVLSQESSLHVTLTGSDFATLLQKGVAVDAQGNPKAVAISATINSRTVSFVSALSFKQSAKTAIFGLK